MSACPRCESPFGVEGWCPHCDPLVSGHPAGYEAGRYRPPLSFRILAFVVTWGGVLAFCAAIWAIARWAKG